MEHQHFPRANSDESLWGYPDRIQWSSIIASIAVIVTITTFFVLRLYLQYQRGKLLTLENFLLLIAILGEYAAHSTNIATSFISQSWTRPSKATQLAVSVGYRRSKVFLQTKLMRISSVLGNMGFYNTNLSSADQDEYLPLPDPNLRMCCVPLLWCTLSNQH